MMMKLLFILSVLPAILAGDFNARTLSVAEQDSILAVSSQQYPPVHVSRKRPVIIRGSSEGIPHPKKTCQPMTQSLFGEEVKVRDAVMSPNGRYVAFAKDNNLYIHKADFGTEVAVTKDENRDIINGVADWLYEEEFGITALYAWSPDSRQLAFVKLDETEVPTFSWDVYSDTKYPSSESLRYPKAGCANAKASVCVYDVATKGINRISGLEVSGSGDYYIPRLKWTESGDLLVLRLNRDQTKMEVLSCNARSTVIHPLYREESKQYFVDYSLFDEWLWLSDGSFIALSEKDGWRRAYWHNAQGIQQKELTPSGIDVTALYAVDESTRTLYYQAAPTPSMRYVYAVSLRKNGTPVVLSGGGGIHSARFSKDGKRMIECIQAFDTPNIYALYHMKGTEMKKMETLEGNDDILRAWEAYGLPEPEMIRIPNGQGQELEAMLMKPSVVSNQPLALVVMHYSGPASQRVLNRWRKKFEYALVEAGYAVLIVDPRGSDCRGRAWRNETYMNLGVKEAEDLISAARFIGQREDIDAVSDADDDESEESSVQGGCCYCSCDGLALV